jgi:hypothetical protein
MDDTMSRLARELADAIAAAIAADPQVEACRERARAAGYELQVSLEAVVGFAPRQTSGAAENGSRPRGQRRPLEINQNDRRFLKSLRIAPDDTVEEVEREE